jgi:hypothetical protein
LADLSLQSPAEQASKINDLAEVISGLVRDGTELKQWSSQSYPGGHGQRRPLDSIGLTVDGDTLSITASDANGWYDRPAYARLVLRSKWRKVVDVQASPRYLTHSTAGDLLADRNRDIERRYGPQAGARVCTAISNLWVALCQDIARANAPDLAGAIDFMTAHTPDEDTQRARDDAQHARDTELLERHAGEIFGQEGGDLEVPTHPAGEMKWDHVGGRLRGRLELTEVAGDEERHKTWMAEIRPEPEGRLSLSYTQHTNGVLTETAEWGSPPTQTRHAGHNEQVQRQIRNFMIRVDPPSLSVG